MSTDALRSVAEFNALCLTWPALTGAPRGQGQPVLVLPGLGTGDALTAPLRRYLRWLGYPVYGWRQGINIGPTERISSGMRDRLCTIAAEHGQPVSLVGWSLGGIFSRNLARETPELVRQVITLGSPYRLSDPDQTNARFVYEAFRAQHSVRLEQLVEDGGQPLGVPSTSIYSRLDGVTAWQICVEPPCGCAENVAVNSSHLGLAHNLAVMWTVADRLALRPGEWHRFEPPSWLRLGFPAARAA